MKKIKTIQKQAKIALIIIAIIMPYVCQGMQPKEDPCTQGSLKKSIVIAALAARAAKELSEDNPAMTAENRLKRQYKERVSKGQPYKDKYTKIIIDSQATFKCNACDTQMLNQSNMITHIKKHIDTNPYESPLKKKKTSTEIALNANAPTTSSTGTNVQATTIQPAVPAVQFGDAQGPAISIPAATIATSADPSASDSNATKKDSEKLVIAALIQHYTTGNQFKYRDKYKKIVTGSHVTFSCNMCSNEIFDTRIKILRHIQKYHAASITHTNAAGAAGENSSAQSDKKPKALKKAPSYHCSFKGCTEKFMNNWNMRAHLRHHDSKAGSYNCTTCQLWYFDLKSLTRHINRCHQNQTVYT